ncbi:MAG TPA: tRNA (N6-threonylcarbamoyladenosine(37)-N6)-methyltransferase TrmO [Victivallales bacterium]|nr:tRNA (N6-threonylcarbamoyladenosine(37)-N6)-methyltransferase TrmO [Victivallales bacterium]
MKYEKGRIMDDFIVRPIGVIRTAHLDKEKTPIQPCFAEDFEGEAEVFPEYAEGIRDVKEFSHIYLVYLFHREESEKLLVKPFLQDVERGVFATRAPCRPNHIGFSIVKLICREGNVLRFSGADMLDGTPLIDIKPYTELFDHIEGTKNGWQNELDMNDAKRRGRRR